MKDRKGYVQNVESHLLLRIWKVTIINLGETGVKQKWIICACFVENVIATKVQNNVTNVSTFFSNIIGKSPSQYRDFPFGILLEM